MKSENGDEMCKFNKIVLLDILFILFVCETFPVIAVTIKNSNDISAAKADSTIASVQATLDKSIYGFYNMACKDGLYLRYLRNIIEN